MAKARNWIMFQLVLRLYAAEKKEKGEVFQKKKQSYCLVEVSLPQQVRLHRVQVNIWRCKKVQVAELEVRNTLPSLRETAQSKVFIRSIR